MIQRVHSSASRCASKQRSAMGACSLPTNECILETSRIEYVPSGVPHWASALIRLSLESSLRFLSAVFVVEASLENDEDEARAPEVYDMLDDEERSSSSSSWRRLTLRRTESTAFKLLLFSVVCDAAGGPSKGSSMGSILVASGRTAAQVCLAGLLCCGGVLLAGMPAGL